MKRGQNSLKHVGLRWISVYLGTACAIAALLCNGPARAAPDADAAARSLIKAIEAIASYDVFMTSSQVAPDGSGGIISIPVGTVRDVLSMGHGRRVERRYDSVVGASISVIDWKTAKAYKNGSIAIGLSYSDGCDYFRYFNPNCRGLLLTELLRDSATRRTVLAKDASRPGLFGLQLENEYLLGPIKVWIDPKRGDMPAIIETYLGLKGRALPLARIEVAK